MHHWTKIPFLKLIRLYQKVLSPGFPSACRYLPTCSQYAYECFEKHSIVRAFFYSTKRILRCHPWGGSGFDPIP